MALSQAIDKLKEAAIAGAQRGNRVTAFDVSAMTIPGYTVRHLPTPSLPPRGRHPFVTTLSYRPLVTAPLPSTPPP